MTSPPSSLASLLAFPSASQPSNDPGTPHGEDENQAAFLTYLRENYAGRESEVDPARYPPNAPVFRQRSAPGPYLHTASETSAHTARKGNGATDSSHTEDHPISEIDPIHPPLHQSDSPIDPSLIIPSALLELAASTPIHTVPSPSVVEPRMPDEYSQRGEMGGKRRKAPHERAGWNEMDEQRFRKRGRKKIPSLSPGPDAFTGYQSHPHETHLAAADLSGSGTLETDLMEAHREMGLPMGISQDERETLASSLEGQGRPNEIHVAEEITSEGEMKGSGKRGKNKGGGGGSTKEERAEQNRRAQQVYRRKREEEKGQLTAKVTALESRLDDVILSNEGLSIELAAVRAALRTFALSSGTSILSKDGTLVINASLARRDGPNRAEDIDEAYAVLERQARELAKQNHFKRGM